MYVLSFNAAILTFQLAYVVKEFDSFEFLAGIQIILFCLIASIDLQRCYSGETTVQVRGWQEERKERETKRRERWKRKGREGRKGRREGRERRRSQSRWESRWSHPSLNCTIAPIQPEYHNPAHFINNLLEYNYNTTISYTGNCTTERRYLHVRPTASTVRESSSLQIRAHVVDSKQAYKRWKSTKFPAPQTSFVRGVRTAKGKAYWDSWWRIWVNVGRLAGSESQHAVITRTKRGSHSGLIGGLHLNEKRLFRVKVSTYRLVKTYCDSLLMGIAAYGGSPLNCSKLLTSGARYEYNTISQMTKPNE